MYFLKTKLTMQRYKGKTSPAVSAVPSIHTGNNQMLRRRITKFTNNEIFRGKKDTILIFTHIGFSLYDHIYIITVLPMHIKDI